MTKTKIIGGITYILGENDKENHEIIKKSDINYWWFHLNNNPSGHCIVNSYIINNNIIVIASNFIQKYSKNKKNKVNICYTQIKNIKILNKPGMVEIVKDNNKFEHNQTIIFNSSKYGKGHASEYIIPNGNINITNHGIGSGIYGITKINKNKKQYEFKLETPYILKNNEECDNYINASTMLNERMNNYNINSLDYTAELFCETLPGFKKDYVFKKLKEFKNDYKNRKDIVMMPINYIMMGLNYDGIYSKDTILDTFNKGNIKFTNYPSKKNILPIKYFKKRNGINEYIVKY